MYTSVPSMTAVEFVVLVSLKRDSNIINTASRYEPETVYSFGHTGPVSVVPAISIYSTRRKFLICRHMYRSRTGVKCESW